MDRDTIPNIPPDCIFCSWRNDCPRYDEGTFCSEFSSKLPDPKRKDPNPEGWEPEDDDF